MDSVKIFKGYDKLQHHPNPKPKPFTATLSILAILFLTFTFAFALASILHHHHHHHHHRTATESPQHQQLLNSAESIRVVCNVTRFPGACLAAIPPSPNATSPQSILALSLRASVHALRSVASTLAAAQGHALADCRDQLDDALSRLNDSLSAAAALTDPAVADVQTWVSAAVTDQQTCLDGLEEVGDVAAVAEMKKWMKTASEYTSNSLAIVANIRSLLSKFHMTLH